MPDRAPAASPESSDPLQSLRAEYLRLVRVDLPAAARGGAAWPIRLDHCFMRVVLDEVFGRRWTDAIDRRRGPAYRQLSADQLRRAIAVAPDLLAGGPARAAELDDRSLRWRGHAAKSR